MAPSATGGDPVDAAAQAKVESWVDTAPVPAGAVRVDSSPVGFLSYQGWTCEPMATVTAYWTVSGTSMVETGNWLLEHPIPGLITTRTTPYDPSTEAGDELTFGNIPEHGSQEGVALSVIDSTDGVVIRAQAGAIPADAVCQTPEPGTQFGSPGEG